MIPGQGTKIPHAMEQMSLYVTTTELIALATVHHNKEPVVSNETQCSLKKKKREKELLVHITEKAGASSFRNG